MGGSNPLAAAKTLQPWYWRLRTSTRSGNFTPAAGNRVLERHARRNRSARLHVFQHRQALALLLHRWAAAIAMLRLSVLAIALTLGIGPDGALLCRAWCAGDVTPTCHPELTSPAAVDGDCCKIRAANPTTVLLNDARQGIAPPNGEPIAPQRDVAMPPSGLHLRLSHDPSCSYIDGRIAVLRI